MISLKHSSLAAIKKIREISKNWVSFIVLVGMKKKIMPWIVRASNKGYVKKSVNQLFKKKKISSPFCGYCKNTS